MRKFPLIFAACLLVTLALVAVWFDCTSQSTTPSKGARVGAEHEIASSGAISSAAFSDLQGKSRTLGQWDGKLLVINFWATWCAPCKEEIPEFVRLQEKYGSNGLQIVGIAADSRLNVGKFAKSMNINYPLLLDEAGAIEFSKRLGNRLGLLPHTVVLNQSGSIIYNKLGMISESELTSIIVKNTPKSR